MTPAELRETVIDVLLRWGLAHAAPTVADDVLRVVREAMREPSEEMCAAGAEKLSPEVTQWADASGDTRTDCAIVYLAMLAAAPLREE